MGESRSGEPLYSVREWADSRSVTLQIHSKYLNYDVSDGLKATLRGLVQERLEQGTRTFVLDLSKVSIVDSCGVGLMIGLSVGILCYLALTALLRPTNAQRVQRIVLPLVAAGMVLQATQLLIQADWLPAGPALWNSSALLSEHSISGQMAYAVFGYEATPTAVEIGFYLGALVVLLASQTLLSQRRPRAGLQQ